MGYRRAGEYGLLPLDRYDYTPILTVLLMKSLFFRTQRLVFSSILGVLCSRYAVRHLHKTFGDLLAPISSSEPPDARTEPAKCGVVVFASERSGLVNNVKYLCTTMWGNAGGNSSQ
jgi:hypothetical protein